MSRRESPILFCEYPFLFDPQAKMLLLRCDATRQGECFPDHPVIRTFWEVFHKLSLEQKKWFLKFLTGTDRVPILGLKALNTSTSSCGVSVSPWKTRRGAVPSLEMDRSRETG
ncbi:hypothetical protein O3P69_012476 [Scylla paramamosain]|uniref:HECT-type E3 ubiquitin transferase n=1 Tax=Scylla paramamosain TaxID=85552 RepID=A0AAW0SBF9_SCYPA